MTDIPVAANDHSYHERYVCFMTKIIEITGVLAASAFLGYQMIDLVAWMRLRGATLPRPSDGIGSARGDLQCARI